MRALLALLVVLVIGCGSSDAPSSPAGGGAGNQAAGGASGSVSSGGAVEGGRAGQLDSVLMPLINHKGPAFSSDGPMMYGGPQDANDDTHVGGWGPMKLPGWIAFDVSAAPAEQRGQILFAWYAPHAGGWISAPEGKGEMHPVDYTIEVNAAPGGGDAPSDGWTEVARVTGCQRGSSFQSLGDLAGGNWVRMSITKTSDPLPGAMNVDIDIYSAPNGPSDSWLLMGDSITYISTAYAFSDLPEQVTAIKSDRVPAVINAAIGGTNTGTAKLAIDDTIRDFPGRYVTLNYGTNDHANEFYMEELVQKVIAAGKVPVVPHMPWSQGNTVDGPNINTQIDALYTKYPEILKGPDLWALFEGHTEWIPVGDIHPNGDGAEQLRKAWAKVIAGVP